MQTISCGFVPALTLRRENCISQSFRDLGTEVSTPDGSCLMIENTHKISPQTVPESSVRRRLLNELTLIPGIGEKRALQLRRRGAASLKDLKRTAYQDTAEEYAEIIENDSVKNIISLFRECRRGSDPLLLGFAGGLTDKLRFFDIETLGMFHAPIILLAVGEYIGDELRVTQYLLRNIDEEITALCLASKHFSKDSAIVSYNGKSFDVPYMNNRLSFYGEDAIKSKIHFDLLYPTRKLFRSYLPDCCLGTAEDKILGIKRDSDLPGYLVPEYYHRYLWSRNTDILVPIAEHNELDAADLGLLLNCYLRYLYG